MLLIIIISLTGVITVCYYVREDELAFPQLFYSEEEK